MLQQVVGATVNGLLGDHVVTGLGECLQGIGDGGGARGDGETSNAALERGDTVFEDALGGVGQTTVDVTGVGKAKAVGGVLGVAEHIARGLVDRHTARESDAGSALSWPTCSCRYRNQRCARGC